MKTSSIAIVGMAGRFPGARNTSEFWSNLHDGVESIRDLTEAELLAAGASSGDLANPDYVRRAPVLDGVPLFDASFFGFSPRDASIMDPQHRHFLECAWEALEDAAHPPQRFSGSIGVFAGSGMNTYLIHNLLANRRLLETAGLFQLKQTGNDKDVLATRVSYQLDLRGPSINVQTACSTSLVAVHLACQSLLNFECDMALAGGVTIEIPHGLGYIYREGEILSRDGHCRSFDASSSGTVFASGLGIVVLRRLEDALADRDNIRAVILGSAINNDGARKVGYLAPSVEGQAEVIAEALDFAGVSAADIGYVEAHGTGTVVGDPIEVRALTKAFLNSAASGAARTGIGSLKSNVGHLDAAAGVSGLIKTVLSLQHAQIPPSLHFHKINPHIELAGSPFYVNDKLSDWPSGSAPRRAGVSSLGIGGTNAHVVLEEAPRPSLTRQAKPYQILAVSGKTEAAADQAFSNLAAHLHAHSELNLADVAFTCQLGRQAFPHRRALAVEDTPASIAALASLDHKKLASGTASRTALGVVFLFSGQGSQYVNMGRELYHREPVFREALDLCAKHLRQPLGIDLIQAMYPPEAEKEAATERLNQTWLTQPTLFAIEYALARWWISLGVEPAAMVGHSIGEYVAACLAGVFTLEDALAIVAARGRLIYDLPAGSMLAVPLAASEISLTGSLSLAAVNNPRMCVVSGPTPEIAALEESLSAQSIACRRLFTSHAFHSAMMEPILCAFEERLRTFAFHPPRIPYLSNVTGTWIKTEEAIDPAYWARHIRATVRFSANLDELFRKPDQVLIEAGPSNVLTSLARQQGGATARAFQSLPHPRETVPALRNALQTLGQLWALGVDIDWAKLHAPDSAQRIPLPTYPFERQKFWIEPDKVNPVALPVPQAEDSEGMNFYRRIWKPAPLPAVNSVEPGIWLVFRDALGLADTVASQLKAARHDVIFVDAGSSYQQSKNGSYTLRPAVRADYDALIADLLKAGRTPRKILHLWSVTPDAAEPALDDTVDRSFYSPLFLAQALAAQDISCIDIALVSNRMQQVADEAVRHPARAVLLGPARVIHKELPGFACIALDLDIDVDLEAGKLKDCAAQLVAEMAALHETATVAYRHGERFTESLDRFNLAAASERPRLERGGVYLITGGLGSLGLVVAEQLARDFKGRLVLVGRSAPPPESQWESAIHDAERAEPEKEKIRKLIEIRSLAGSLVVAQADVTNLEQMRKAVAQAQKQFGKIDGVFHAAGVLDDGPLMLKTAESTAHVLDPKVRGTLVLEKALRNIPLKCFVLFSSISSILPPAGQVDYAAANAFLDAFALSRKGPITVVNWGSWREVGMAARAISPHPWLEEKLLDTSNEIVYGGQFSQQRRWVLSEHKFKNGVALIPGTGHLEMVAGAFAHGSLQGAVEFQDVFFLAPIMFSSTESKEVRVQLQRERDEGAVKGSFRFSVFSHGSEWVEHSTGTIAPCHERPAATVDRAAIAARCRDREIVFDANHRTRQERQFDFGPRWQSLRRLHVGKGEALAEIELEDRFSADVLTLRQHPALLDMATGAALYLTQDYDRAEDLFLPISYRKIRVYHQFPARLFSHIRTRQENRGEVETFDITIFDEQGQVLAEIDGFAMRRIADPEKIMEGDGILAEQISPEELIDIAVRPGIPPREGARALARILLSATPTAVVAVPEPLELTDLNETDRTMPASVPQAAAAAGTAPRADSIEATLAAWWQELLGVERVGLDDNFFELGGHSLIGVRLFAKIKKTYRVDLELGVLFEDRTVRRLSALIAKAQQPPTAAQKSSSTLAPIRVNLSLQDLFIAPTVEGQARLIGEAAGQHLHRLIVPVQDGDASRPPIFMIHAYHLYPVLPQRLGGDQAFYGVQEYSPGEWVGDWSLEAMMSRYVQAIRLVQPHGPYFIGGFCSSAIPAFEVARQLEEANETVGRLILIDSLGRLQGADFFQSGPGGNRLRQWFQIKGEKLPADAELMIYLKSWAAEKLQHLSARMQRWWCSRLVRLCMRWGLQIPAFLRLKLVEGIRIVTLEATRNYTLKQFHGKMDVFLSDDFQLRGDGSDLSLWTQHTSGEVRVTRLHGDHIAAFRPPHVDEFARELRRTLDAAIEECRNEDNMRLEPQDRA